MSFRNTVVIMTSNIGSADILAETRAATTEAALDASALVIRERVMAQVPRQPRTMPNLMSLDKNIISTSNVIEVILCCF